MERPSSSSSTTWEIMAENRETPITSISEVMAGSFCREKQITNILDVKEDESDYLLRFKDGSEEWVKNEELDETTKDFYKLAKPVKRVLKLNFRKLIKIEHVKTKTIHKISTSGINNVQELSKRYAENTSCNVAIDLYTKDKETDQLMPLAPEELLPIMATKVFAKSSVVEKLVASSTEQRQCAQISKAYSNAADEESKISSIAQKSTIASLTTSEATREVLGAVGGSGGKGIDEDATGSRCAESPSTEEQIPQSAKGPEMKMTESLCSKMSDSQKIKLAIKMSEGTLSRKDLEEVINSREEAGGAGDMMKHMVSLFTGLFGIDANQEKLSVNEPESKVNVSEAHALEQEQKPTEEPENICDIVIGMESVERKSKEARPIIHSQPVFNNNSDNMNGWLLSLEINDKEELLARVEEKITEIETAHVIEISEMENRHSILVTSLRDIIKRQAAEKSELILMMKQNKRALLTAIEAQLDETNKRFEQNYESFFQDRRQKLENINNWLEKKQVRTIQKLEQRTLRVVESKKSEPKVESDENHAEVQLTKPEAPVFLAPQQLTCPGEHELRRNVCRDRKYMCDKCTDRITANSEMFSCRQCNFDICGACFRNQELAKESDIELDIAPRGMVVDDGGYDSKGEDDLKLDLAEDVKQPSLEELILENIVKAEGKEAAAAQLSTTGAAATASAQEELSIDNCMEKSLELLSVEMLWGGFISEPMEISVQMKNVDTLPIQCLASLTTEGESSGLRFIGFKTSSQLDKKIIQLDLAPGDIMTAVIEFEVPQVMQPKKYDFYWQLTDHRTGDKVGPQFSLQNLELHKPLDIAEQEDKVRKFCSLGFVSRREDGISALASNGWDLNKAVNEFISK